MSASPGLRGTSYPGLPAVGISTPTGLRQVCLAEPQPRWGWLPRHIFPKVARCSQPWALRRNPFGIQLPSSRKALTLSLAALLASATALHAADYPAPVEGDYIVRDFRFVSGETLPEVRMHYRTLGKPVRDKNGIVRNAVLILHGTTGSSAQFLRPEFAGELFGKGQLLDATRYFIVIPDNLGHGQSTKPSDGLRAKFPRYGYRDMIEAQRRLLTEGLGVNHLRLIIGTSMGGMHTWLWGEMHPDFMDALMPLASLPAQISGRNRVWRRLIIDAIRTDPEWREGNYQTPPRGMRTALEMSWLMGNNPVQRLKEAPTLAKADDVLERYLAERLPKADANDYLYAFEASHDYDPGPGLEKIKAPLLAINFADDLINPPELGVLEREIKRVKRGKAILIPLSEQTRGHGTHTLAPVWKKHLAKFLKQTETRSSRSRRREEAGIPATAASASSRRRLLLNPDAPQLNLRAPDQFRARFETSKGNMLIEVHRDWSPRGADRFYHLVRSGYYDDARFLRVIQGGWAQFGIGGDPRSSAVWRERTIPDDPRHESNLRGTVAFAFAVPNGRTTQVFINLADNSATHDAEPFVPFGRVVQGMDVADALNSEYGESAGGGIRGGKQAPLFERGNAYLLKNFPRLDFITHATIAEAMVSRSSLPTATRLSQSADDP
ncbi:MAG TPA: alpha/beta fold hydrolase [Verrucomicrobiae bacterium]|nr:alpha/beta fold hydrolase [Verrucomicrobiae bacterium]